MAAALPVEIPLRAYRGDTWAQTFRLLRDKDVPLDLTGAVVEAWARNRSTQRVEQMQVVLDADLTTGVITLAQPPGGVPAGAYEYDIEVTEANGTVTTWVAGQLLVEQDVTHAV